MGVDSGLPDFRGEKGFWNAYPAYERLGLTFVEAANPAHFEEDPEFGWGFYGHRTHLYRDTEPHGGFGILKRWIDRFHLDHFIVTSNVDGHFQKAGFDERRILEVHGSIHHLQCLRPCSGAIWPNREEIPVDHGTMRAARVPRCIRCGDVARPNVLMFGDFSWIGDRTGRQESRFGRSWRRAGVSDRGRRTWGRHIHSDHTELSERLGRRTGVTVVRVNPRNPGSTPPTCRSPTARWLPSADRRRAREVEQGQAATRLEPE